MIETGGHVRRNAHAWHAATFFVVGTMLVGAWATFGHLLQGPLRSPRFARGFNAAMATLLLISTLPVLLGW